MAKTPRGTPAKTSRKPSAKATPKKTPNKISKKSTPKKSVVKAHTAVDEKDKDGKFKRQDAGFRNWISSKPDSRFKPEKDRYHLYIAWACPWANRCAAVRHMKGLTETIGMSVVHPTWRRSRPNLDEHSGWIFGDAETTFSNTNG